MSDFLLIFKMLILLSWQKQSSPSFFSYFCLNDFKFWYFQRIFQPFFVKISAVIQPNFLNWVFQNPDWILRNCRKFSLLLFSVFLKKNNWFPQLFSFSFENLQIFFRNFQPKFQGIFHNRGKFKKNRSEKSLILFLLLNFVINRQAQVDLISLIYWKHSINNKKVYISLATS